MEMVGFAFPEVRHSVCTGKNTVHKPLLVLMIRFCTGKSTEKEVFANVRAMTRDSIVCFCTSTVSVSTDGSDHLDGRGKTTVGTHEELLQKVSAYATLFTTQEGEDSHEA